MAENSFSEKTYALLRRVPRGKITTYKVLAHALHTKAYRAVGTAMNRNPYAPEVPCHRVVKSNGEVGKFAHGTAKKIEMLKREGIPIKDGRIENFEKYLYKF
ncbi:MAG TPA: MGMT family protein [Candidatus Omnitrophota bacterium]|nr:MGMT family protein [Candidatus Omnitrophota bacterium]